MELRQKEILQLISYAEHRDREGWYYGPKKHFEARHERIVQWLQEQFEKAKSRKSPLNLREL